MAFHSVGQHADRPDGGDGIAAVRRRHSGAVIIVGALVALRLLAKFHARRLTRQKSGVLARVRLLDSRFPRRPVLGRLGLAGADGFDRDGNSISPARAIRRGLVPPPAAGVILALATFSA